MVNIIRHFGCKYLEYLLRVIYDSRDLRYLKIHRERFAEWIVICALFQEDPGLIPRLCEGLFSRVEQENGRERIYRVTIR